MNKNRKKRWMSVAHRAADFRALIHANEVLAAADEASACHAQHQADQAASVHARSQWSGRLRSGAFYTHDVALWKAYQQHLHHVETASAEHLQRAQAALEDGQARLRSTLGERDALQASLDQLNERLRSEQARADQKDADELWPLCETGMDHED
jgi:flagellar biosynthesis chaperone FliJ